MPNWVLATEEFPSDMIGYIFDDESTWVWDDEQGVYWQDYNDVYAYSSGSSISKINPLYIADKNGTYYNHGSSIYSHVATTPLYNDNGHITFGMYELTDGYKLLKGSIPNEYGSQWCSIDVGYTTQNIDTDYERITLDFKWSGIINDELLNDFVSQYELACDEQIAKGYDYPDLSICIGYSYAGFIYTKDDILNYSSGTNFINEFYENDIEYENTDGTENFYIVMKWYDWLFTFDSDVACYSMFFYDRHENKWYYYILWDDKNDNTYYYDATEYFDNKSWLHVDYSRYKTEGTLKFGERTFTFPVNNNTVKLRLFSRMMPIFRDNRYDDNFEYSYYIYGYTQIANIKSYVVPLEEEDLGFNEPYVYVRNSNYRDNFFLSVEVENYDPNGYEVLWDTGAKTVSIPCRLGEYHEVTVTNRAGSTKAWNVAGFGDARFYKYRVNVADLLSVSDIGKSSNVTISLTNNAEYATQTDCTPSFTCGNSNYTAEVKVIDGHVTIDTTGIALRTCGYYSFNVSRYNQYNEQANGIGFGLSWKMKLIGDIGEWIQYSYELNPGYDSVHTTLDWDVYGFLISDSLYGRNGIRLSVVKSHGELKCVAYSVNNSSEKSVLPDEFMNGEWVDCYLYKYDTGKYFFNVNNHTVLNFEDNSLNVESLCLFNTSLAGSMSALILNEKTPKVIHSEIKRSMELVKNQWD